MSLYELALEYAEIKNTSLLAHREEGDEITFVLASGQKITFTKSQLHLAIANIKSQAGVVADVINSLPSALPETAPKARKPKKEK